MPEFHLYVNENIWIPLINLFYAKVHKNKTIVLSIIKTSLRSRFLIFNLFNGVGASTVNWKHLSANIFSSKKSINLVEGWNDEWI